MSRIAVVCKGNIARSQVFEYFLKQFSKSNNLAIEVFSYGVADKEAYPNADILLREVEHHLARRGIDIQLKRKPWSIEAAEWIKNVDIVLVADKACKDKLFKRLTGKLDETTKRVSINYTNYLMNWNDWLV